ncbi:hypothetical protein MKZ38_006960 [Zalerion maritima]|uniref:DUF7924 domain-containing protein n=1 Tax=Zalerion maritima TaxID=339359 RepID=A0AAD5RIZ8_9PEZI|nr:hypothetical protein MKZ38_006960 [Zalerion maritima]
MARPRKRQQADDLSRDPPPKRIKSAREHHSFNYPPKFWDNLSRVSLTPLALRELDRRNNTSRPLEPTTRGRHCDDLARFARHGGPNLSGIRGLLAPRHPARIMSSSGFSQSRRTQSTKGTSVPPRSRITSTCNRDFERHLIDNGIYPEGYDHPDGRVTPEPDNMDEILKSLAAPRASLSPSRFPQSAFRDFRRINTQAFDEDEVMRKVAPVLGGNADIPNKQNTMFTMLKPMTDGSIPRAKPDYFDGVRREDIHGEVRDKLGETIIATDYARAPVLPNFFMEAKGPDGAPSGAQRQVCYDGAIGARAMHSLQNYGNDEPVYDGNAYAIGTTYHDGQLKMYAHYPTPTTQGGPPEYHMTQIDSWGMTGNLKSCVDGIKAFRNGREWAKEQRDSFIEAANARAWGDAEAPSAQHATEVQQDEFAEPRDVHRVPPFEQGPVDSEEFAESQDVHGELPFEQGPVDYNDFAASQDINEEPAVPQYIYTEGAQDESQESAEPPCFATSFTSSFSTHTGSKRPRISLSPPSSSRQHKKPGSAKSQTHAGTGRGTSELSTQASTSTSSAQRKSGGYWTWSKGRENWYHSHEDGSREWYKGKQKKH